MDDYAFDPEDTPARPWDFKKAQARLKEHGYVLLAYGPIAATYHRADAERDRYGLLPDKALVKVSRKEFDKFLRSLGKDA